MSKKPIKSNLFRFVTLRSPQTIEEKNLNIGFVSFPEEKRAESLALKAVETVTTEEERKTALKTAYDTGFTPVAKRQEVKNLHDNLYMFSNWLMRNKANVSYASIKSNSTGAQELTLDQERVIWDNLFYQTIHKTSTNVREALIQVLVANKFLKAFNAFTNSLSPELAGEIVFTEENEKEFIRRANASIIVPKEVVLSSRKQTLENTSKLPANVANYMKANLEVAQTQKRLQNYEAILGEVQKIEKLYTKKEQARYQVALEAHTSQVEALKKAATPTIQKFLDFESGFEKTLETFPELELPKFEFIKNPEIDRNINTTDPDFQFSQNALNLLNSEDFKNLDTLSEVNKTLEQKIKTQYQTIFNTTPEDTKNVNVRGENISINVENQKPLYSYTGYLNSNSNKESSVIVHLKVEDANNISVTSATYEITNPNNETLYSGTTVKSKKSSLDSVLEIEFFPEKTNFISEGSYKIKAEFTLSSGETLTFGLDDFTIYTDDGYLESKGIFGQCVIKASTENVDKSGNGILYGISQLGIADFRRVEQEVCCYVPGEVSHIENIMAKEYKERTTRNLSSRETSTERNSEREVENLTDTSTTERNEMHNEASSIVNKDTATSFGANASYTGFGATVGMNYNRSSSNAISDSNTQAKTYAQDVTEKALERVIQKTSTKRTSRILQEYEENNSHGFDNRKGDKHINGVYRWVDKVYKNKVVNYGKRLMYEFALPEPAKFLINSQIENNDDAQIITAPKKPVHPKDLKNLSIKSPSDLSESNYQILESIYGIDIDTPLANQIIVNKSKSGVLQKGGGSSSFIAEIPDNYESNYFTVTLSGSVAAGGVKEHMSMVAVVGGITPPAGKYKEFFSNKGSLDKVKDELPYSIHTWDVGAYTLSLKLNCNLTNKAKEEWKSKAYKKIIDAYNIKLQDYNINLKEYEDQLKLQKEELKRKEEEKSVKDKGGLANRAIEKRELKRIAIDLLTKPFDLSTAESHYINEDYKTVNRSESFHKHNEVIKFFEQAFDWEIMAYTFYPYFYGAKANWNESLKLEEGNDPIFKAFLQSAMAKTIIPVRQGFEDAVNWYMKTGEIWNGQGMVTNMDDDLYVSIAEEMKTLQGDVEGTWETRVPTSLTVLQADSVALDEGGLPCNPNCEENGIFSSVKTSPDGVNFDIVGQTNTVA
ncbi:hypothetical protein DS884_06750 [Tenacibaculum sp. E3R01]|uniref:hypothetical protein n=1 Tax=Tenacibaculum sp. E3R01 TaxID=2267227 RepID=UPI000DEA1EFB|nr:hypothetical protein [Tenacibaculum sp. E3R01]RBW59432.1 hypothetical protein DS884_06750 [Tenacibaculum sp. E3R01]